MSNSMDDAITRVDTMNNFPNVMRNLGISAKESQKSIDKMSEKLIGLPTTVDAGARAVQRFTSKNKDVGKSTDMFLALNNALLAGGASMDLQANALEQISQAYAKGKPDMIEWRSILNAMPAQASQLGEAFGLSIEELGEALRHGDISMDQFMNKVMELNTKGVGSLDGFEKQARRATAGLRTNITNLKTAVVRGMADSLNSINESLKKANLPSIQKMIQILAKKITEAFKSLNNFISKINWNAVITAVKLLTPLVISLFTAFMAYKAVVGVLNAVATAQALLNAVMMLNPIGVVVALIAVLIVGLIALYKRCEWFRKAVNTIFNIIKLVIGTIIKGVVGYFTLWIKAIVAVINWIKSIPAKIKAIPGKIVSFFASIPDKLVSVGENILKGLWNGINSKVDWVVKKIKGLGKSILNGMKKVLGIKSPSKEFAIIGKFSMLGYQEGLEKMKPEIDKAINGMFSLSPSMTGTMNNTLSPNINVTNNVNVETDPLGQVVNKIKTFSGGAKNDYNYGYGG